MSLPTILTQPGATAPAEVPVSAANPLPVSHATAYPPGATALVAASGNVAAGVAAATLTIPAGKTGYLTGFEVSGSGATAAAVVTVTVTGLLGGTLSYTYTFVAGVALANQPLIVEFTVPLQASAANTNIVVSCPSGGSGNTNSTVVAHGYYL